MIRAEVTARANRVVRIGHYHGRWAAEIRIAERGACRASATAELDVGELRALARELLLAADACERERTVA